MDDTIAMVCLVRDEGRCFRCGTDRGPFNAHHRLGGGLGPDSLENRISLHGFGNNLRGAGGEVLCHGWVHQNGIAARENGWVISRHDRRPPQQVPVRHWQLGLVFLTREGRVVPEADVVAWRIDGSEPLTESDLQ